MAQHVVFYRTQPQKGHVHKLQRRGVLRASAEFSSGCYEAMGLFVSGAQTPAKEAPANKAAAKKAPAKSAKKASK